MEFSKRFESYFGQHQLAYGEQLFKSGCVRRTSSDSHQITGTVQGTRLYNLELRAYEPSGLLWCNCNCPHFDDGNWCKHLWAFLRSLDHSPNPLAHQNLNQLMALWSADEQSTADLEPEQAVSVANRHSLSEVYERQGVDASGHNGKTQPKAVIAKPDGAAARPEPQHRQHGLANNNPPQPLGIDSGNLRELLNIVAHAIPSKKSPDPKHSATPKLPAYVLTTAQGGFAIKMFAYDSQTHRPIFHQPLYWHSHSLPFANVEEKSVRRLILALANQPSRYWTPNTYEKILATEQFPIVLPHLIQTGRFFRPFCSGETRDPDVTAVPIEKYWPDPLQVQLYLEESAEEGRWKVMPVLVDVDGNRLGPGWVHGIGHEIAIVDHGIAHLPDAAHRLLIYFHENPVVFDEQTKGQLQSLIYKHQLPFLGDIPKSLQLPELDIAPIPCVNLEPKPTGWSGWSWLDYDGHQVDFQPQPFVVTESSLIRRDLEKEQAFVNTLLEIITRHSGILSNKQSILKLSQKELLPTITDLMQSGWRVELSQKRVKASSSFHLQVKSGVDWFDLDGQLKFGDQQLELPQILQRIQNGNLVQLNDGSMGVLPEGWWKKFASLLQLGQTQNQNKKLRFRKSQGLLLDVLLDEQDTTTLDAGFLKFRQQINRFQGIEPSEPADSFQGKLRPYQQEGLSWLNFLQEFELGGCLADDMGLGKTVQVLALLDNIRQTLKKSRKRRKPSLLVVPKSLLFNWQAEATRFAPQLKVLQYHGTDRATHREQIKQSDLIITTYGTMRSDIDFFRQTQFHYVILDEAQAIKNSGSLTATACRLLTAKHRLALTGTPIENRLSDLGSILEFLNPGLLGTGSAFANLGGQASSPEVLQQINRALRPIMLRRTKEQVLKDLPAKTESIIFCEIDTKQRQIYDQVKKYYQQSLAKKVASGNVFQAKTHVLEALLRLRQIACHPGLVDPVHQRVKAAKLELLDESLQSAMAEGHKVLVFSQFTSLLAIVRKHLDKQKIVYEYLDGKTDDRQGCVTRFNEDPKVSVFLISLKAGGHGLNLTSADYVYILDPWWNPAVESQAIDRAHRIGQTKPVFAYRLIAKDTVEEKIIQLQASKRQLAEAVITADTSLMKSLSLDDLQMLLS